MGLARLITAARCRLSGVPGAVLGLWLSVAGVIAAATMGLTAKLAGQRGVPVFQIVLARSLVLMSLTLPQLIHRRVNPLNSQRKRLLLLRGLLGFGAVSSYYGTVQYLPLGDTAVLMFLAPLFVAAASPLLLKELPSRGVWVALPLSVVGVVLVAQPSFIFGGAQALSALGVALGVLQAALSASAKMCIRALGSTEPVVVIVASMAAVSIALSSTLCAALPHHFVLPADAATWLLLLATGLLGFGNQYLSTASLKLAAAAPAVAMSYMSVLWGMVLDLVVFHQPPGLLSLLGAAIVGGSSWLVVRSEQQRATSSADGGSSGAAASPVVYKQLPSSGGESEGDEATLELIEAGQPQNGWGAGTLVVADREGAEPGVGEAGPHGMLHALGEGVERGRGGGGAAAAAEGGVGGAGSQRHRSPGRDCQ